jgi:glutathione synthase/RimK-type ligase-like ATP-grasp enzyme
VSNILITMNEDAQATRHDFFGVTYKVDEHDCLHYAAALDALGHDVFFVNWNDLRGKQFARMFSHTEKRFVEAVRLEEMDLIWVYQMEGFYGQLSRFLEMVDVFENACARVINDPRTIRHNLGKQYLWALEEQGIRVIPTYRVDDAIVARLADGERFVVKPLYGERGKNIFLASVPEDLARIASHEEQYIAQEYIPGVREGERSLMFLGLDYQHAVLKRPNAANCDEFRCNESLGGTVSIYEATPRELAYAARVLRAYESLSCPVHYSRIDFLCTPDGPVLMEAELVNPAAFANYSGKGAAFGRSVANYMNGVLAADAERHAAQTVR